MGEASAAVKGGASVRRPVDYGSGSILDDLTNVLDRIDRAKEVKQDDQQAEGKDHLAENHFKVGCLTAAKALVARAKALLEDYGGDLDEDINPLQDVQGDVDGDVLKRRATDLDDDLDDAEEEEDDDATPAQ